MKYTRMLIEAESPEELGYGKIKFNLSESSVSDRKFKDFDMDLDDLTLLYGEHRGEARLRRLIAKQSDSQTVVEDDVLICNGAAGALFIIATSLLDKDSHLVVIRPNYATNIETPRAIGCEITYIDLKFDDGFRIDLGEVEKAIRPNTVYISVTCPHNPTGTVMSWADLARLGAIAEKHDCLVLVDETYRDLAYSSPYPTAAAISDRFISVSSLSKAYGTPGIRLGWLITRRAELYKLFLAAKEQIGICGSVVDEAIGYAVLRERSDWLAISNKTNLSRLAIVREWVRSEAYIEWVEPSAGVVCFPRLKVPAGFNLDKFYDSLLKNHHAYVGAGDWFEMPRNYMRIGFGWPEEGELRNGLASISAAIREQL
ncbi:aspartate aminotransferase [Chromobacterium sp. ATCC 53434]|uniref:pyridoxal phosphate-dependent aminotransferase n=1 Tax=Chromobacterium sp. (strain ATCC 53434 / SC 14030) TaxID=2059672 RepID=UPI000C77ACC1|nr:pyridoxal phosphate-dependent aminotransferase [Chromobacterium sp. ATCC 53434]AUH51657.1 aspartate aminotransferase [Chromobacterium sp. ATCC 53434]